MTSIVDDREGRIRQLRAAVQQASAQRARSEVQLEQAQARAAEVSAKLKSQFGVSTLDEARAKLAELRASVDSLLGQAEEALKGSA